MAGVTTTTTRWAMTSLTIDWKRLARPQADGSDTGALLELLRDNPRLRRYQPLSPPGEWRYFDGRIGCVSARGGLGFDGLAPARVNHANIGKAAGLLEQLWPEVHRQIGSIITHLCPMSHLELHHPMQSCSGCFEHQFGLIYASVEHPFSLAEALVHEMAHHKLFAMGVGIESCDRLIRNQPTQITESDLLLQGAAA